MINKIRRSRALATGGEETLLAPAGEETSGAEQSDRGAVLVLVALMALILLGIGSFAVDFGMTWAAKRTLSVSADAAALAAAGKLAELSQPGTGCVANQTEATSIATTVNEQNAPGSTVTSVTVTCDPAGAYGQVKVVNQQQVDSLFGGIFGASGYQPTREATARFGPASSAPGLRPWAVCVDDAVAAGSPKIGQVVAVPFDNFTGKCGTTAPGNWGLVDFDDGSNPTGDIRDWTLNGYPGSVCLGPGCSDLPADPGASPINTSSVLAALDTLVSNQQVVEFPLVSAYVPGGGNNASFATSGVVSGYVCGYDFDGGQNKYNYGSCWDSSVLPDPAVAQNANQEIGYFQVKITNTVSSYVGAGSTCGAFGSSCDYGVRWVQLYE